MTYAFAWERLERLIADGLEDLAILHWEEAERDKEDVPLALDFQRAIAGEKIGQHRTASLRKGGELVGYAAFTVTTALFHSTTLHAFCTAVYVDPDHRGFTSLAFLAWCEGELKTAGVRKLYVTAKRPEQCDLFEKLGYAFSETTYSKLLGVNHVGRHRSHSVPAS